MDERVRTIKAVFVMFAVVILLLAVASYVSTYRKSVDPASFRSFVISAEGKAVGIPDIAQFTFSVITEGGKDVGALQKENSEKMNTINEFLKSKNVSQNDIKTSSYNVEPRYQYYSCPSGGGACRPPEIVGYTINQSVSVKIRDFAQIGDLLAGVVENGANSVSQLAFTIDDPTKVQDAARLEAVKKATEKAQGLARAGEFRLGKLLSIDESNSGIPTPYPLYETKLGMGGGGAAPAIEPGSQEVLVTVTLKYEMR